MKSLRVSKCRILFLVWYRSNGHREASAKMGRCETSLLCLAGTGDRREHRHAFPGDACCGGASLPHDPRCRCGDSKRSKPMTCLRPCSKASAAESLDRWCNLSQRSMPIAIRDLLVDNLEARPNDIAVQPSPLGLAALWQLYNSVERHELKYAPYTPKVIKSLKNLENAQKLFSPRSASRTSWFTTRIFPFHRLWIF